MPTRELRKLLEDHQGKQVGALMLAAVRIGPTASTAAAIAASRVSQLAKLLTATADQGRDIAAMNLRGLYADMDATAPSGSRRGP